MGELSQLPNIGVKLEAQLNEIGIYSADELKKAGSENAWILIQKIDPSACIHRLMALEGAIENIKKTELPDKRKAELKKYYMEHRIK